MRTCLPAALELAAAPAPAAPAALELPAALEFELAAAFELTEMLARWRCLSRSASMRDIMLRGIVCIAPL